MPEANTDAYAGDISADDAWRDLAATPQALLIDVRTAAEWAYVGVPSLASIGKAPLLVEWDEFPSGALVPDFIGRLKAVLASAGADNDAPLYFLCRSGNRSRHAAIAATAIGYRRAYNITQGFEGRLDPDRHRATPGSWKALNLPWVQS
jgi:rhodanese-related sulfurtransferase